ESSRRVSVMLLKTRSTLLAATEKATLATPPVANLRARSLREGKATVIASGAMVSEKALGNRLCGCLRKYVAVREGCSFDTVFAGEEDAIRPSGLSRPHRSGAGAGGDGGRAGPAAARA